MRTYAVVGHATERVRNPVPAVLSVKLHAVPGVPLQNGVPPHVV